MAWTIPLFDLDYGHAEQEAVRGVIDSKWLTMGARTEEFEQHFAIFSGSKHAIAVANGTAALHLALLAAGVGPGDEVIVPDITFVASANAAVYAGATVVLADVIGDGDLTVDPADIARKITERTKAIVPVHLAGYPCRMDEIDEIARSHGLAVVEDCAHSPGARYAGTHTGGFGLAGCFSFFSNKNLATGEGGMVITNDDEVARHLRTMRSHGMSSGTTARHSNFSWGYDVTGLGFNYRISEIEAALGIVQLGKLPAANEARAAVVAKYAELLGDVEGVEPAFSGYPTDRPDNTLSSFHVQIVLLPEGVDQPSVAAKMADRGIQTSWHYRPIHTFSSPHVKAMRAEGLDRATAVGDRLMTLPLYPAMTDEDVQTVVSALVDALSV